MNDVTLDQDAVPETGKASSRPPQTSQVSFTLADGSNYNIIGATQSKLGDNIMFGTGNTMHIENPDTKRIPKKAKKSLSKDQREPSRNLLEQVSKDLLYEDSLMLGRYLGLTDAKIDEISTNFKSEGVAETKYQILAEWKKKEYEPTIAKLAKCLNSADRGDISDKLPSAGT